MLQLKCVRIIENQTKTMADFEFELMFDGQPTVQFTSFLLPPDFCDLGDVYNLTAQDFEMRNAMRLFANQAG